MPSAAWMIGRSASSASASSASALKRTAHSERVSQTERSMKSGKSHNLSTPLSVIFHLKASRTARRLISSNAALGTRSPATSPSSIVKHLVEDRRISGRSDARIDVVEKARWRAKSPRKQSSVVEGLDAQLTELCTGAEPASELLRFAVVTDERPDPRTHLGERRRRHLSPRDAPGPVLTLPPFQEPQDKAPSNATCSASQRLVLNATNAESG